jgi:hypothetical protein
VNRCFKTFGDTVNGGWGFTYYEFTDELCTRQMYVDDIQQIYLEQSSNKPNTNMSDQPLSVLKFLDKYEISKQEFEDVWMQLTQT